MRGFPLPDLPMLGEGFPRAFEGVMPRTKDLHLRFVFDYFVKDHLGKVRMTLTDGHCF